MNNKGKPTNKPNDIRHSECGKFVHMTLSKGYECVLDAEDYPKVAKHRWYAHVCGSVYPATNLYRPETDDRRLLHMHNVLVDCPEDRVIDHIDGNSLDNRKVNMRICTTQQNMQNKKKAPGKRPKWKGPRWISKTKRWEAVIRVAGKQLYLGVFKDDCDAAQAYNFAAAEYFGNYACLNEATQPI